MSTKYVLFWLPFNTFATFVFIFRRLSLYFCQHSVFFGGGGGGLILMYFFQILWHLVSRCIFTSYLISSFWNCHQYFGHFCRIFCHTFFTHFHTGRVLFLHLGFFFIQSCLLFWYSKMWVFFHFLFCILFVSLWIPNMFVFCHILFIFCSFRDGFSKTVFFQLSNICSFSSLILKSCDEIPSLAGDRVGFIQVPGGGGISCTKDIFMSGQRG